MNRSHSLKIEVIASLNDVETYLNIWLSKYLSETKLFIPYIDVFDFTNTLLRPTGEKTYEFLTNAHPENQDISFFVKGTIELVKNVSSPAIVNIIECTLNSNIE